MSRRVHTLTALAAAALLAPAGSRGQNLEISPVLVDLSPASPSAVVTVHNTGASPARYQVTGQRWSEDRAGRPSLTAAPDLAVFPPLFELAAGASRKVRVGATVPPEAMERSWRLIVEEIPSAVARSGTVMIRTRFAIPVFLAPQKAEVRCDLALARADGKLQLQVTNRGTTRVKPTATRVDVFSADGAKLKELEVASWYVLAGGERAWDVPVPKEICSAVRRARVVAEVGGRTLEASQDLPGGACGP